MTSYEKSGVKAAARFFLRIGQAGHAQPKRDEETMPLFTLPMIMDCEGMLCDDLKPLARDAK